MSIKAAFFDIDGTLVSFKTHRIPDSTHLALKKLREKGIKIFISSGRHLSVIDNLGDEHFDGYITVNGSLCYLDGKIIHRCQIPQSDIHSWIDFQGTHNVDCCVVTEKEMYINNISEAISNFFKLLNLPYPDIIDLHLIADEPVYQIVGLIEQGHDIAARAALPHCAFKRWHPSFADIVLQGSDKSSGMQALLDRLGITPAECIAFGDGGNDIEMLQFAGIGVAMGGSAPVVLQSADYETTSVDEDGIINALTHFHII